MSTVLGTDLPKVEIAGGRDPLRPSVLVRDDKRHVAFLCAAELQAQAHTGYIVFRLEISMVVFGAMEDAARGDNWQPSTRYGAQKKGSRRTQECNCWDVESHPTFSGMVDLQLVRVLSTEYMLRTYRADVNPTKRWPDSYLFACNQQADT